MNFATTNVSLDELVDTVTKAGYSFSQEFKREETPWHLYTRNGTVRDVAYISQKNDLILTTRLSSDEDLQQTLNTIITTYVQKSSTDPANKVIVYGGGVSVIIAALIGFLADPFAGFATGALGLSGVVSVSGEMEKQAKNDAERYLKNNNIRLGENAYYFLASKPPL